MNNNKAITASDLIIQQQSDPVFAARQKNLAERRSNLIAHRKLIEAPIVNDLKNAGFVFDSIDELRRSGISYPLAIPILLHWLSLITDSHVKESIVRTLSVPFAKPLASQALINEFKKISLNEAHLKWAIGNALSITAENSIANELYDVALDARHGKSREMIVLALGNISEPCAIEVLIKLLEDDEVCGHAIKALAKLKAQKAFKKIEFFLNHPKTWIRNEAIKAIKKLTKK
jgi:hypothetical protein